TEDDVFDELRDLSFDNEQGQILVLTHQDQTKYQETEKQLFLGFLSDAAVVLESFSFPEFDEKEQRIFHPGTPSRIELRKVCIPFSLADSAVADDLIRKYRNHEMRALVLWFPDYYRGQLLHLSKLTKNCPDLPVYIWHPTCHAEKFGVEREGSGSNWQDEFPALADVKPEPLEMVVENFLIKGNIHVAAGRHETYKTMALIELADAILSERPVFDQFKVTHRYPILFLCPDMSSDLLDDYAAPFNLRAHGADFRVQKGDIIHAVDSPALQAAVKGRILILDTMLDFANIKELGQSGEWITFMQQLRELITVHGCIAILMTAHANKPGAKAATIDSSDYLKDSVTFGGKVDVAYGFKAITGTSQILIERIKGRGFKRPLKFTITVNDEEGNSCLDGGRFPVCQKPGEVKIDSRKGGRPIDPDKQAKIDFLSKQTGSYREMTEALKKEFPGSTTSKDTVKRWMEVGQENREFAGGLTND
ncbi:MAG: AAA family ATPase, partial [Candidatus Sulfotelmatobacter sp.]